MYDEVLRDHLDKHSVAGVDVLDADEQGDAERDRRVFVYPTVDEGVDGQAVKLREFRDCQDDAVILLDAVCCDGDVRCGGERGESVCSIRQDRAERLAGVCQCPRRLTPSRADSTGTERSVVRLKHPDTLGAILERDDDAYRLSLNSDRSSTDIAFASRTQTAMNGESKDFRVFRGRP